MTSSIYPTTINFSPIGPVIPGMWVNGSRSKIMLGTGPLAGSVIFAQTRSTADYIDIYCIDKSGDWTHIAIKGYQLNPQVTAFQQLGSGYFILFYQQYSTSIYGSFIFQIANLKINNTIPIIVQPANLSLTSSCTGAQPDRLFYDPIQQLLGAEYIHAVGAGGQIYANIYKQHGLNFQFLSGGFVCNYPPNIFDQTGASYPGTVVSNTQTNMANGYSSILGYDSQSYYVGGAVDSINPGTNSGCVNPSSSSVITKYNRINRTPWGGGTETWIDTDLGNVLGAFGNNTQSMILYDLFSNSLQINFTGEASHGSTSFAMNETDIFGLTDYGWNNTMQVTHASITVQPYFGITPLKQGVPIPLGNFSMPVRNILYPNNGSLS